MGILDELNFRMPGTRNPRPSGMRAAAENYAASLGLTPGGPGWGDAIRELVLNGGSFIDGEMPEPMAVATASDDWAESAHAFSDDHDVPSGYARHSDQTEADLGRDPHLEASGPLASAGQAERAQPAQLSPFANGPFPGLGRRREPDLSFREDDPKFPDLFGRRPSYPPLIRPLKPKGRPTSGKADIQKRRVGSRPGENDTVTWANRIADRQKALPAERRAISDLYGIPLSSTPTVDRLYATMLAKERGLGPDGKPIVSRIGMVGPAQMLPSTARDAHRYSSIPYNEDRLYNDRAYNEMLGLDYFKWLAERYDGDYVKAAAAYNMGLGKFGRVLETAAQAGTPEDWEKYLPYKETREYVTFFKKFNRIPDRLARPMRYLPVRQRD